MKTGKVGLVSTVLFMQTSLLSCSPGAGPSSMVQICLGDAKNLADFRNVLRSIARSEHMSFVDGSAETKLELERMHALGQPDPIINIGLMRNDGFGILADNIGLPGYQVTVGFSQGPDPAAVQLITKKVVRTLKASWEVRNVAQAQAAQPLTQCNSKSR